ncbi:Hypothetical protein CINCED_3A005995, partial [Cinara cedri]
NLLKIENGSEVVDPKCEISDDSRAVTTVNQDPLSCTTKAARIGYVFSHVYFSVLRSSPEYADDFYDVDGEYRTIYADGSTVVAKHRNQVKSVLMRPTSEAAVSSENTSVQELVLSIPNDLELDSAAKKLSVQEPAFSITESVNIIEHDIDEGNNQKLVISSEITSVREADLTNPDDLEPHTGAKSIFVQEPVFSIIETVDIIEHDIDEENI